MATSHADHRGERTEVFIPAPASASVVTSLPPPRRLGSPNKPQEVWDYDLEIYFFMKKNELEGVPGEVFAIQPTLTPMNRAIVIDWVIDIHRRMHFHTESLYLTVRLMDLVASKIVLDKIGLQKAACAALLISTKSLEMQFPAVDDLVNAAGRPCTADAVKRFEADALEMLGFNVGYTVASQFIKRFLRMIDNETRFAMFAYYACEVSLLEEQYIREVPSKMAAAAVMLATAVLKGPGRWRVQDEVSVGYTRAEVEPLAARLLQTMGSFSGRFHAVRAKFAPGAMAKVSLLQLPDRLAL